MKQATDAGFTGQNYENITVILVPNKKTPDLNFTIPDLEKTAHLKLPLSLFVLFSCILFSLVAHHPVT